MINFPQLFQEFKKEHDLDKQKHDISKLTLKEIGQLFIKETLKRSNGDISDLDKVLFADGSSLQDSLPSFPRCKYDINRFSMKETQVCNLKFMKNEGFYLTAKLLKEAPILPAYPSGVTVLLQDKNEDIMRVSFYDLVNIGSVEGLVKSFEKEYEGEEINIKHPFLMISEEDGLPLMIVSSKDEFFKSSQISKRNGNKGDFNKLLEEMNEMKEKAKQCLGGPDIEDKLERTIELYLASTWKFINTPVPVLNQEDLLLNWKIFLNEDETKEALAQLAIVFSNCSYCYLKNKQPLFAFHYAQFAIWCDPSFFKARLRAIEAKIQLLHVEEALDDLENIEGAEKFKKERENLSEQALQQRSKFSSAAMRASFFSEDFELKQGQTFIGPIELKQLSEKSRGFFAKKDIQKGETILIDQGIVDYGHGSDFDYHLLEKLEDNEDLKPLYMNLFPSKKSGISKMCLEDHKIKAKGMSIEANFNAYRFKNLLLKEYRSFTESEIHLLAYKSAFNSICVGEQVGLFLYFCLINHSCAPNTCVYFNDEVMLIVAKENIKKGEEVFVSYVPLSLNKLQRKEKLKLYDFECKCDRCEELGDWKEKEANLTGIRCSVCRTVTGICCEKRGFLCPKDCFFLSESEYEKELAKDLERLAEGNDLLQSENEDCVPFFKGFLKDIDSKLGWANSIRANVLCSLAEYYALEGNEKMFMKYFEEIVKIIEYFPNPDYRILLNNLVSRIPSDFGKRPSKEQLKHFEHFGLSLETCVKLEEVWVKRPAQVSFLPMSSLVSEAQEDLDDEL